MMSSDLPPSTARPALPARAWIALLLCLGVFLALVGIGYRHGFVFDCRAALPDILCGSLSLAVPRAVSLAALGVLYLLVRPDMRRRLTAAMRPALRPGWLAVALLGGLLILLPLALAHLPGGLPGPGILLASWLSGLTLLLVGLVAAVFSVPALGAAIRHDPAGLAIIATLGLVLPEVALSSQSSWKVAALSNVTFDAVVAVLNALGQSVVANPAIKQIGIDDFVVEVGPQCSGIEGFALITVFTGVYLWLFRDALDMRRAWVLIPLGLLMSWLLNAVRIAALIMIGRYVSPDLAIEGFHSHAGWLMFLTLSVAVALSAHHIRWFRRAGSDDRPERIEQAAPARPGFFADPVTARLLPFAVFMLTATLAPAVSEVPGLLYPLRALAMTVILALCWRGLSDIDWWPRAVPAVAGVVCGVLWLVTAPPAGAGDLALQGALAALPPALLVLWIASRVIGTIVLVPVIEELFFRGYLLTRLTGDSTNRQLLALLVSSVLFGMMHDRFAAGALAGLLFGILALRSGRLGDAITAHIAANTVIAIAAIANQDWSLI